MIKLSSIEAVPVKGKDGEDTSFREIGTKIIYVSPNHIAAIRPDYGNASDILVGGQWFKVRESLEEIKKEMGVK